jgi:CubicO group peptidase (beta-lactamase class C family)
LIAALSLLAAVTGNSYLIKGVWACYFHGHSGPVLTDKEFFKTRLIEAPKEKWEWPLHSNYNKLSLTPTLQSKFKETGTQAFLVIQNDSILMENYWDVCSDSSQTNSFSMAKSITTMLAEIAIEKGIFSGWHQKVKTFLPNLKGAHADELELWHLSTMSSGLDWEEHYKNPFGITAKTYYGSNVRETMSQLEISSTPGKEFIYQSGTTELLAFCLMKATGKPLATLASEWLWKPMGAMHDARWHTDDEGTELAWCCFNSNARDFARFGKLMLHHGNWNGTKILDSAFTVMATTTVLDTAYGYAFWLDNTQGTKAFFHWGLGGQYIITVPEYNIVIVRLGYKDFKIKKNTSGYCRLLVHEVLGMLGKSSGARMALQ